MTDKELRKLSRPELLELLVTQGRELAAVQQKLADAEKRLEDREILLEEAGSIAAASLQLNDVIGSAQRAADQYSANMKRFCAERMARCEAEEAERREASMQALDDARDQAESIVRDAQSRAAAETSQARQQAERILAEAMVQAQRLQDEAGEKARMESGRLVEDARRRAEAIIAGAKPEGTKERKRHFWQRGDRE